MSNDGYPFWLQSLSHEVCEQEAKIEKLAKQKIELQKRLKQLSLRRESPPTDQQIIPQADKGSSSSIHLLASEILNLRSSYTIRM